MPLNIRVKTNSTYRCDVCDKLASMSGVTNISSASQVTFTNGLWFDVPTGWVVYPSKNVVLCQEHRNM